MYNSILGETKSRAIAASCIGLATFHPTPSQGVETKTSVVVRCEQAGYYCPIKFHDLLAQESIYETSTAKSLYTESDFDFGLWLAHVNTKFVDRINELHHQIDRMTFLSNNWDGEGSEAPSAIARDNALKALSYLESINNIPTYVEPSVEGGVAFTWIKGEREAVIEFYNDSEVVAIAMGTADALPAWYVNISDLPDAIEKLLRFAHA